MRHIRQEVALVQQQKLFMTTELRQAISVLQMSALELNEYIVKKIEENPFLDEEENVSRSKEDDIPARDELTEKQTNQVETVDIFGYFAENTMYNTYNTSNDPAEANSFEFYLSEKPSLYEHLQCQLYLELSNPTEIMIGNYLIGNIDGNGYLRIELDDAAKKLCIDTQSVEKVLSIIQAFTPLGVGARSLQECLLLQLENDDPRLCFTQKIVKDYLQELSEKKWNKIATDLSISIKDVQETYDLIRTLDPKPGLQFGYEKNPAIWPDITVRKEQGQDRYTVIVNDSNSPSLKINYHYANLFRQATLAEDSRKYLEERFESALGLIRGIEQRRINIHKVAECIVEIQKGFLDNGITYLKPLTMSSVAEIVGIHESTVSRVVNNKYVQTPRGLFALKYFFNSGLDSSDSKQVCSKSIKYLIAEIVNQEDATKPLSDQEIREVLMARGISISRRTVNKYRQSMGIPTNLQRRRY